MTQLLTDAREFHKKQYGEGPFVVVSAPGVVNLFGDLTEQASGILVQFAISQRMVVSLSPRSDNQIRFFSREFNEKKRCTLQTLKYRKEDRWANFVKGAIYHQIDEQTTTGFNVSILSDIPIGGGYSSSQALTLASVLAISEIKGFRLEYDEAARMAYNVEKDFVKNNCHPASFFPIVRSHPYELLVQDLKEGKAGPLEATDFPHILLLQTNVPLSVFDDLFHGVRDDLNKSIRFLEGLRPQSTVRDYDRIDVKNLLGQIPEEHRRRALFLVEEIARAKECVNMIKNKDWKNLGKSLIRSHESLRDLLEISCPEIDWLVKRAADTVGVYGARMITNGSGASVLVLAEEEAIAPLQNMLEEYERIFSFHPTMLITQPAHKVEFH